MIGTESDMKCVRYIEEDPNCSVRCSLRRYLKKNPGTSLDELGNLKRFGLEHVRFCVAMMAAEYDMLEVSAAIYAELKASE